MAESSARLDGNNKRREKLAKLGIEMKKKGSIKRRKKDRLFGSNQGES